TIRQPPPLETNLPDPFQALYCPPGAPFEPVHFTKYPPNPAYAEYDLETILIADPLARTRETEYIGRKEKRIEVLLLLFKDKYNYLPTYFVPMTLPLTPQPNRPIDPPTAAETMFTQLFGVLYINLMHPSYDGHYPLAQPYSVLSQPLPPPMPGFLTNVHHDIFLGLSLLEFVQLLKESIKLTAKGLLSSRCN
ncbi:hypothetical protein DSO57_1032332, partial [Entomophthora muscae]